MDKEIKKIDYLNNLASLKRAEQYFIDNPNCIEYIITYAPFTVKITKGEKLLKRFYEISQKIYEYEKTI